MVKKFTTWIKQFENDNNSFGDLARDIQEDRRFTKKNSFKGLYEYLAYDATACQAALDTFEEAWKCYLGYKKTTKKEGNILMKTLEPIRNKEEYTQTTGAYEYEYNHESKRYEWKEILMKTINDESFDKHGNEKIMQDYGFYGTIFQRWGGQSDTLQVDVYRQHSLESNHFACMDITLMDKCYCVFIKSLQDFAFFAQELKQTMESIIFMEEREEKQRL